jgi:hypothetical protein
MASLANTLGGGASTTPGRTENTCASSDATLIGEYERMMELKEWTARMPECAAPFAEFLDLAGEEAWRVAPAWRRWVEASRTVSDEQSYALHTAGFSMEIAEAFAWDALMDGINSLDLEDVDYELVMSMCEYNRSLTRFRKTVETELAFAAERHYASHVVDSVRGMIEIARDTVARARSNIRSEKSLYRQLDALDEERKQMRKEGRKDTEEYALLDRAAEEVVNELSRRHRM